jgi:hypothetical protein
VDEGAEHRGRGQGQDHRGARRGGRRAGTPVMRTTPIVFTAAIRCKPRPARRRSRRRSWSLRPSRYGVRARPAAAHHELPLVPDHGWCRRRGAGSGGGTVGLRGPTRGGGAPDCTRWCPTRARASPLTPPTWRGRRSRSRTPSRRHTSKQAGRLSSGSEKVSRSSGCLKDRVRGMPQP